VTQLSQRLTHVLLTLGKELRESLRDRRTLAVMILFPLVVYPLLFARGPGGGSKGQNARGTAFAGSRAGTGWYARRAGGPDSRAAQTAHPG
jgi:hypothetical protein